MAVLDLYGRPMAMPSAADLTEEIAGPSMGGVRQITSGHPADGLTPARLGAILREAETGDATAYLELAEQMEEKDLHYSAVLGVRKRAIRRLNLVVEAGADDDKAQQAAGLVRSALTSSTVSLNLINMLDAIGKGYSISELIWDVSSKPWVIRRVKFRDPRWFRFDQTDGETPLLRDNDGDRPLNPFRFVYHCALTKSGLPIRGGLARLVAWAYVFKNFTIKDWAIFMEAYGHPLRLGRFGPNATEEDKRTLLRAVRLLGVDMAAIIPKSMEVELVKGSDSSSDKMFEGSARFWDEQISKAVLGQVSTTDAIAGGHAVGKVHNEVRDDIRDADAEQLAATLERDVAAPITILNCGDGVAVPNVRFEAEEEIDKRLTLVAVKTFGPMGLQIPEQHVRDVFGLREPQEGEAVLTFPAAAGTGKTEDDGSGLPPVTASQTPPARPGAIQTAVADLIGLGRAQDVMDASLGGLLDAIDQAETLDEVRDLLAEAAEEAPNEDLRELLARLNFNARLAGELAADIA